MRSRTAERIPLNLILDYPVKWSKYKVLRDFLQNFYDAVGNHAWHDQFSYELRDGRLTFQTERTGFSYEWLVHIGASTKRGRNETFAGYFGEGFKIASLCAVRDYGWNVEMASRDWELEVFVDTVQIEDRKVSSLAYRIFKNEDFRQNTLLHLYPFDSRDVSILESALYSFYYPQNPLFSEKIWESSQAAVYYRSGTPKPSSYPSTYSHSGDGIIFAGYQALGSFGFPLVFALHGFRLNDRERNSFYMMDVVKVIEQIVGHLPPGAAMTILEIFKRLWYRYPRKQYDFDSWYTIIRRLAHIVSSSQEHTQLWKSKYPQLLVATPVKQKDLSSFNRRRQALSWLAQTDSPYRLVQDGFRKFGYPSLEEMCDRHDGFSVVREPDGYEGQLIRLLEETAEQILPGFWGTAPLPPCKVIKSESAVWAGMASCIPLNSPVVNSHGLKIRYRLPFISVKARLFHATHYGEALSTYFHELAHMFGGDHSPSFSRAVTEILEATIRYSDTIQHFEQRWHRTTNESRHPDRASSKSEKYKA